jgi:hypothetical protein
VENITSVECRRNTLVYNLHVDGDHRYFVQGYLVHNCDCAMSPGSARTECIVKIFNRPNLRVKRILSGTMSTDSPFELWSQYMSLDWRILGYKTFVEFRHRYGEYPMGMVPVLRWTEKNGRKVQVPVVDPVTKEPKLEWGVVKRENHNTGALFEDLERDDDGNPRYRNLDELKRKIDPWRMRVRRSDVSDAPAKIPNNWYYQMSSEQARVYTELRDRYVTELRDGSQVRSAHVLTRMLRLQQVLGNNLPAEVVGEACDQCGGEGCEDCDNLGVRIVEIPARPVDPDQDPRLERLLNGMRSEPVPTIIWARFRAEVDLIERSVITQLGRKVVRYDGAVSQGERRQARDDFQSGAADVLVGNQDAGGRNLRLDAARLMVFYSNTFSRRTRIQAEDRAEAVERTVATGVADLVCEGSTMDQKLASVHRAKGEVAALLTGDKWREFL